MQISSAGGVAQGRLSRIAATEMALAHTHTNLLQASTCNYGNLTGDRIFYLKTREEERGKCVDKPPTVVPLHWAVLHARYRPMQRVARRANLRRLQTTRARIWGRNDLLRWRVPGCVRSAGCLAFCRKLNFPFVCLRRQFFFGRQPR